VAPTPVQVVPQGQSLPTDSYVGAVPSGGQGQSPFSGNLPDPSPGLTMDASLNIPDVVSILVQHWWEKLDTIAKIFFGGLGILALVGAGKHVYNNFGDWMYNGKKALSKKPFDDEQLYDNRYKNASKRREVAKAIDEYNLARETKETQERNLNNSRSQSRALGFLKGLPLIGGFFMSQEERRNLEEFKEQERQNKAAIAEKQKAAKDSARSLEERKRELEQVANEYYDSSYKNLRLATERQVENRKAQLEKLKGELKLAKDKLSSMPADHSDRQGMEVSVSNLEQRIDTANYRLNEAQSIQVSAKAKKAPSNIFDPNKQDHFNHPSIAPLGEKSSVNNTKGRFKHQYTAIVDNHNNGHNRGGEWTAPKQSVAGAIEKVTLGVVSAPSSNVLPMKKVQVKAS
jgi:hypothetical protein